MPKNLLNKFELVTKNMAFVLAHKKATLCK